MDPGRGGSSSRTEFGREGSSSPTGTPGARTGDRTDARVDVSRVRRRGGVRAGALSRDSPRRAPPTPSSMTAARCSPSSSRAGSTSTNSSPRGRHPPNPRRGGIEPAPTTKPRASVSNGRERHRPSLRPPSRLVFSRRGSWRRTRGTPPRVSASTDDGEEDGQRGDRRHRRATYPRGRRSVPSR